MKFLARDVSREAADVAGAPPKVAVTAGVWAIAVTGGPVETEAFLKGILAVIFAGLPAAQRSGPHAVVTLASGRRFVVSERTAIEGSSMQAAVTIASWAECDLAGTLDLELEVLTPKPRLELLQ